MLAGIIHPISVSSREATFVKKSKPLLTKRAVMLSIPDSHSSAVIQLKHALCKCAHKLSLKLTNYRFIWEYCFSVTEACLTGNSEAYNIDTVYMVETFHVYNHKYCGLEPKYCNNEKGTWDNSDLDFYYTTIQFSHPGSQSSLSLCSISLISHTLYPTPLQC